MSDASTPRRKAKRHPSLEGLEQRAMLTGGAGNTFALISGQIASPDQPGKVNVTLDRQTFQAGRKGLILGVDVVDEKDGKALPFVKDVTTSDGKKLNPPKVDGPASYVRLVSIPSFRGNKPLKAVVEVGTGAKQAGGFLAGFFLPGDVYGDGKVDQNDITAIKSTQGAQSGTDGYNFNADANRNGMIDAADLKIAQMNLGAKTYVQPILTANLDPASDSGAADRITNKREITFTGTTTPGAKVTVSEPDGRFQPITVVTDAKGTWKANVKLADGANKIHLEAIDSFGQTFSGDLSPVTYDATVDPGSANNNGQNNGNKGNPAPGQGTPNTPNRPGAAQRPQRNAGKN